MRGQMYIGCIIDGVCGSCYDFFINHLTSITLATALLTDV
jgi:hypothetical protein